MSSTGTKDIWSQLTSILSQVAPVVLSIFPTDAAAITLAVNIAKGVIEAVPTAISLYEQITDPNKANPTAAELAAYAAAYQAADDKLEADIEAALKATPA